jgi:hypothetical protein
MPIGKPCRQALSASLVGKPYREASYKQYSYFLSLIADPERNIRLFVEHSFFGMPYQLINKQYSYFLSLIAESERNIRLFVEHSFLECGYVPRTGCLDAGV